MEMGIIKVLPPLLVNKIAAGEVIEKYSSVVKELVENSIDAGSSKIKVELVESGLKEIKVIDDGKGMARADALLAFTAHATSKVLTEMDLEEINSLGFRGEALPSIAAVSEVILKTSDGKEGTVLYVKGGQLTKEEKGDLRQGTIVSVKNIFYNTPARLKHLGSLYREYALILNYLYQIALAHPQIAFTLINNQKVTFNTDGSGKQLKVIQAIYGLKVTKKMLALTVSNDDYLVEGYFSYPEITKANRNHLITIVNGRVVRNLELNREIINAYHSYIPNDKYPIVILNIIADPALTDVNIHPTKLDLKFSKFKELKTLIYNALLAKLKATILIPEITTEEVETSVSYSNLSLTLERQIEEAEVTYAELTRNEPLEAELPLVPELYPVGLIQGTYIVCQNELGMYLIDQHAAAERVNYEFYLKQLGAPATQTITLLVPFTIELTTAEFLIIKENFAVLTALGFVIEEIGINTLLVRGHPYWLKTGLEKATINKIIDLLVIKEQAFSLEKFNEKVAISLSCRLAIKGNENISIKEMESLISQLRQCENPWTCPHGRPTIIHYSNYELEKLFKRAG